MRTVVRKSLLLLLVICVGVVMTGCPQRTKIGDLTSNPSRYANKDVAIAGNVTTTFGALGTGAYQVDDGTGRIWVISENYGVPSKGARVGVAGRITEGLSIGGRSFAMALRQTQRARY
jgi:hypothetical protein